MFRMSNPASSPLYFAIQFGNCINFKTILSNCNENYILKHENIRLTHLMAKYSISGDIQIPGM